MKRVIPDECDYILRLGLTLVNLSTFFTWNVTYYYIMYFHHCSLLKVGFLQNNVIIYSIFLWCLLTVASYDDDLANLIFEQKIS